MKQITITVQDDGKITVEDSAGGAPYECQSTDECLEYVGQLLNGQPPGEEPAIPTEDYGQAWEREAASRPPQPGLMA